jgi:hypothetical protein
LPVLTDTKKLTKAPTSIIPSTPRFNSPLQERCFLREAEY